MADDGAATLDALQPRLTRWAAAHYDASAQIRGLETMPGHAGLSFGFRVVLGSGDDERTVDDLVMRVPPQGVRRSGNTDVLRQVPLLQALYIAGIAVPEVVWWGDDEQWFDVPYTMVTRLPGSTFNVREAVDAASSTGLGSPAPEAVAERVFRQAVGVLGAIHALDWRTALAGWEEPKALGEEVVFWDRLLDKTPEPGWVALGRLTRDRLLATLPFDPVIGLFHGDFQTSNLLFDEERLVAVLDWEISGIGAQLLDVGWLLMMNDPQSWADGEALAVVPAFDRVMDWYSASVGRRVGLDEVAWYRALSGYRFGVISCFNVMLHRTGKRPDVEWDRIAPSVPFLFGRALELVR